MHSLLKLDIERSMILFETDRIESLKMQSSFAFSLA